MPLPPPSPKPASKTKDIKGAEPQKKELTAAFNFIKQIWNERVINRITNSKATPPKEKPKIDHNKPVSISPKETPKQVKQLPLPAEKQARRPKSELSKKEMLNKKAPSKSEPQKEMLSKKAPSKSEPQKEVLNKKAPSKLDNILNKLESMFTKQQPLTQEKKQQEKGEDLSKSNRKVASPVKAADTERNTGKKKEKAEEELPQSSD